MNRGIVLIVACFLFAILVPVTSFSQDEYPSKPINLYIGFSPGGSTDLVNRVIAEQMGAILGQPLVPINKPGGGSTVQAALLAQAKPDGYTIGTLTTPAFALIPHLRDLPYKPLTDFSFIGHTGLQAMGLCVRSDAPWKTLKEFLDYAKNNPEKVSYSSSGAGTPHHIVMEWLAKKVGILWKHIPYPGGNEATAALLGGHVTATTGAATHIPAVKEGRLRMLVVYEGKRYPEFPNIPTLRESGFDLAIEAGAGLAGPKGVPEPILDKLDAALKKAMAAPEVAKVYKGMEMPMAYMSRKDYQKRMMDDYVLFEKLLKELDMYKKGL
jgi:tripartite-type tricarboxylate transporter receptor subunit TctC